MNAMEHNLTPARTGDLDGEIHHRRVARLIASAAWVALAAGGAMHAMSRFDATALRIDARVSSVREDHRTRTDYLFETKRAAAALQITPNKFGDWQRRTWDKLEELYIDQPGETAAELMALIARAEAERQRRTHLSRRNDA